MKKIYLTLILSILSLYSYSQTESIVVDTRMKVHSPKKATLYSAFVPSLGQAYNKKYWKMPIVYAGIGGFSYLAYNNQKEFNRYKKAILLRRDGGEDEFINQTNEQGLINNMDACRKNRDLCIAGALLIYVLQIVDASVDAHFFDFDVSDDLTISLSPFSNTYSFIDNKPVYFGSLSCVIKF